MAPLAQPYTVAKMYSVTSPKHLPRNFATLSHLILQQLCKIDNNPIVEMRGMKFKELELVQCSTELLKCSARIQTQISLTPDFIIFLAH